jgi:hypothetical protein
MIKVLARLLALATSQRHDVMLHQRLCACSVLPCAVLNKKAWCAAITFVSTRK